MIDGLLLTTCDTYIVIAYRLFSQQT